jgi:hypothetical protein
MLVFKINVLIFRCTNKRGCAQIRRLYGRAVTFGVCHLLSRKNPQKIHL